MGKTPHKKVVIIVLGIIALFIITIITPSAFVLGYYSGTKTGKLSTENNTIQISSSLSSSITSEVNSSSSQSSVSSDTISSQSEFVTPIAPSEIEDISLSTDEVAIGNIKLKLPSGWYIKRVVSSFRTLTDDENKAFIKPQIYDDYYGLFPIHEVSYIEISNLSSKLMIEQTTPIMIGPFGVVPACVPTSEEYEIAKMPESSDKEGYMRVWEKSDRFHYIPVYISDVQFYTECPNNLYIAGGYPWEIQVTFQGNSGDISAVDDIYEKLFLENDYKNQPFSHYIEK